MMELIVFKAKASTPEELEMVRQALNGLFGDDDMSPEEIQKLKKSERNKKDYQNRKLKNAESAESAREEREEKEEVLPLSSPSSLPSFPSDSPNNYPITPYNPPLPEEKGEREEIFGGAPEKRGELREFGPHVRLSEEEFLKLQEKFGQAETTKMIRNMNDYIGEDSKLVKKYQTRNHYLTLLNWARRDEGKKLQPKPQAKKTYTFAEVGEMMRNGEL